MSADPNQAPTLTEDEKAIIRRLQHFYCDNIVDGVPTCDWHIESPPEHAVIILRNYVRAETEKETAYLQAKIDSLDRHADECEVEMLAAQAERDNASAELAELRAERDAGQPAREDRPRPSGASFYGHEHA